MKRPQSLKVVHSTFKSNICVSTEHNSGVPTDVLYLHNPFSGSQHISCVHIIIFWAGLHYNQIYKLKNTIIWGLNGVAMARHGPILNHSEATGSRKVSRYLPDLRDTIFDQKIKKCSKIPEIQFSRKFSYFYMGSAAWAEPFTISVFLLIKLVLVFIIRLLVLPGQYSSDSNKRLLWN